MSGLTVLGVDKAFVMDRVLETIDARRSVLPKHLVEPGPDERQVAALLSAAAAAPDHGRRLPWRFVIVPAARRDALGDAYAAALTDRSPEAPAEQVDAARDKARRAPFLMLAVSCLAPASDIPPAEQLVSLGAALQNMLLAAQALGFGAGLTSGRSMTSPHVRTLFGLAEHEAPVCFVSVGTVARPPKPTARPDPSSFTTTL